jgi:hypothetical protein
VIRVARGGDEGHRETSVMSGRIDDPENPNLRLGKSPDVRSRNAQASNITKPGAAIFVVLAE